MVSNQWLFTITTDSMQGLLDYLNANGVVCRPFWTPMSQLPMYKDCLFINSSDVSAATHRKALSIPCSTGISEIELDIVIETIKKYFVSF